MAEIPWRALLGPNMAENERDLVLYHAAREQDYEHLLQLVRHSPPEDRQRQVSHWFDIVTKGTRSQPLNTLLKHCVQNSAEIADELTVWFAHKVQTGNERVLGELGAVLAAHDTVGLPVFNVLDTQGKHRLFSGMTISELSSSSWLGHICRWIMATWPNPADAPGWAAIVLRKRTLTPPGQIAEADAGAWLCDLWDKKSTSLSDSITGAWLLTSNLTCGPPLKSAIRRLDGRLSYDLWPIFKQITKGQVGSALAGGEPRDVSDIIADLCDLIPMPDLVTVAGAAPGRWVAQLIGELERQPPYTTVAAKLAADAGPETLIHLPMGGTSWEEQMASSKGTLVISWARQQLEGDITELLALAGGWHGTMYELVTTIQQARN